MHNYKSSCTFCKKAWNQEPEEFGNLETGDSDFICFKDIRPAGQYHYLVIPKKHIESFSSLNKSHISLIKRMKEIGLNILNKQGADMTDIKLGFHWPLYTQSHLHLHVISPTNQMNTFQKIEFSRFFFGTVDLAIKVLSTKSEG